MWQNCPNSLEILLLGTLLKLMFVLDTFWTKISTSGQSGFERNWADCWTKGVQGPLSWNCSEFTNQITELHVSIIVSANENAQNISKNVRGKNLNWYSQNSIIFLWVCWFLCKNLSNFVYVPRLKTPQPVLPYVMHMTVLSK